MYTLKSISKRVTMLGAAGALLVAAVLPGASAFADSLNPLTERSLLLSSSAPGFQDSDGSGNSEASPNSIGENYAPPGSGPNGKKSGETFSFKVSTDSTGRPIKGFTLQYCTLAAGLCQAPGNDTGNANGGTRAADTATTSDFNATYTGATFGALTTNDFAIYEDGVLSTTSDWVLHTGNKEDNAFPDPLTGKNNYIYLTSATGITPVSGTAIKIVFRASSTNYITNPGSDSFFVKINTYDNESTTAADYVPANEHNIDGGVTVANVMTDSIHITTKVLETMAFSVGTSNPDTKPISHGICDAIQVVDNNRLNLGNASAEYSLETDTAYDVYSYWRLSSNSSGGATVYYSGDTLANTVGDSINPIGAAALNDEDGAKDYSHPGTEQFGLALVDAGTDALDTGTFPTEHITPNIAPLVINTDYADGTGTISDTTTANNAQFAFKRSSLTTPVEIAQENTDVLRCATSKVRYVANIAADTPAGVYTTKINYLAAPQY